MFIYLPPDVLLKNSSAINLIQEGKNYKQEQSILNSNYVLEKCGFGIVLVDKQGVVLDFNERAPEILKNSSLEGIKIHDLMKSSDATWSQFIQDYNSIFDGTSQPSFVERVNGIAIDNSPISVLINVVSLTPTGMAHDGEHEKIDSVALVIEDVALMREKEEQMKETKDKIESLLRRVNPEEIVERIWKNGEISFAVSSVTVGYIRVVTEEEWDPTKGDVFEFFDSIFTEFCTIMKNYPTLSKVRSNMDTFVFSGGLFETVTKPAKSAEECVRFARDIMKKIDEKVMETQIALNIQIGISHGGPVIAGTLGFDRPWFQLVGEVGDMAKEMMRTAPVGKIQITRMVYELIFSAGFRIFEQGDTKIKGGRTVRTYFVE